MKKEIVSAQDLVRLHKNFKYIGGTVTAKFILWLLKINQLNKVYAQNRHLTSAEFIHGIYKDLQLSYHIDQQDLDRIPKKGAFVLIANHPFGGAEAIISLKLLISLRPDFKYMANFMLNQIEPLQPYFIGVNPFETMKNLKSNITGLKMAAHHLKQGYALGIFPAGEVSTYQKNENFVSDKEWPRSIMKFIKTQEVVVVPMFFEGENSKLFHFLGKIHPLLRTLKLPSELLHKKNDPVNIRIGEPISTEKQRQFNTIEEYTKYLRETTYSLKRKF
jgi:putative hemolysin